MKLPTEIVRKLVESSGPTPDLTALVNDACELMTLRVMLAIRTRATRQKTLMLTLSIDNPERAKMAAQVNALNRLCVDLAETE